MLEVREVLVLQVLKVLEVTYKHLQLVLWVLEVREVLVLQVLQVLEVLRDSTSLGAATALAPRARCS